MAASVQSEKLQQISKIGTVLVCAALVLTLAGSWFASSRPVAAIDEKKLGNYRNSLQSYAQEGLLLAKQYEANRAFKNYTSVSAEKLYEASSSLTLLLQTEQPESGLSDKIKLTTDQATELSDVLSTLSKTADKSGRSTVSVELRGLIRELQRQ